MADGSAIIIDPITGKTSTVKDPDASLKYPFNWHDWLTNEADTYQSHSFIITSPADSTIPLTASVGTQVGGIITTSIAGGNAGKTYGVTCRLVTAGGQTDDRTLWVKVKDR